VHKGSEGLRLPADGDRRRSFPFVHQGESSRGSENSNSSGQFLNVLAIEGGRMAITHFRGDGYSLPGVRRYPVKGRGKVCSEIGRGSPKKGGDGLGEKKKEDLTYHQGKPSLESEHNAYISKGPR